MIGELFNTVFFNPIYNGLVFLLNVPFIDVGIAVILVTVVVKLVLFPFSLKMVKTQLAVKQLEPEITKLKEEHKEDKQEQARQTMALYKEKGCEPVFWISSYFNTNPCYLCTLLGILAWGAPRDKYGYYLLFYSYS